MDAWTQFRRPTAIRLSPYASTGAAIGRLLLTMAGVLFLWQSVGGWISICGTSGSACAALCFAGAIAAASAAWVIRHYDGSRSESMMAIAVVVLSSWQCPHLVDGAFQFAIDSGLPSSLTWFAASFPVAVTGTCAFLLVFRNLQNGAQQFPSNGTRIARLPAEGASLGPLALERFTGLGPTLARSARNNVSAIGFPAAPAAGTLLFVLHAWMPQTFALTISCLALTGIIAEWLAAADTKSVASTHQPSWSAFALSAAAGLAIAAVWMVFNRIFSITLITSASAVAAILLFLSFAGWRALRFHDFPKTVFAVAFAALAASSLYYNDVLNWNLTINSTTDAGWKIIAAQSFQLAAWSTVVLMILFAGQRISRATQQPSMSATGLLTGIGVAMLLSAAPVHPAVVVITGMAMLAAPAIVDLKNVFAGTTFQNIGRSVLIASAAASIVCLAVNPPDLTRPARLLFTAHAQAAVHRHIDPDMIPLTDATRVIRSQQTVGSTTTHWKIRGDEVECRINGRYMGSVSSESASAGTGITPQSPVEILTGIIPLTVHPQAGSVLILDDVLGLTQSACRDFPLHTICVTASNAIEDSSTDDRVRVIDAPTEIAVRDLRTASYDVVIDALADPASGQATSRLTQSFYRAAAGRLKDDGVFCQHIRQSQIEAGSLMQILGTVSSIFENVAVIQMVPGELALLATNSSTPLIDENILDRMQRPHVRRQLARCGQDWCQLAALPVIDSADPVGLWEHESIPAAAAAQRGTFGLRLGWEVVRPINRSIGIARLLGPHEIRIADMVREGEAYAEFGRRISAYAQQMEVLTTFPDEPWAYRKSLKSEMLRHTRPPREVRRKGKTKQETHPLDQYRMDYVESLEALTKQAGSGQPDTEQLRTLPQTAGVYEPLISDMAHYEVVLLHELSGHPNPQDEFRHRMHTVYYTPAGDLSVRTVVGALNQLIEQPELIADDAERFDRLNTLVQQLIQRWGRRTTFEPRSARRTQRDVDLSLRTARHALEAMEPLKSSVNVTEEDFTLRRRFVTQALIVPLRDYRDSVLAHRAKSESAVADSDAVDDDFHLIMPDLTN